MPRRVRVVGGHLPGRRIGSLPQVLLANDAVLVHDERHDASDVVLRRPGDEPESFGASTPARRGSAEVVAVERCRLGTLSDRSAFLRRLCHELTERASLLTVSRRPVEAVLLSGIA